MHAVATDGFEINPALESISQRALTLTGATGVAIALARAGSMICRASAGETAPPLGCRLDTSSGFSGECVRSSSALRCDDAEADPRVDIASCRSLGIRSILAIPIVRQHRVVGILEVFSPRPFAFGDSDFVAVKRLAQTVLLTAPVYKSTPPPKLLIEKEAAHRVFFRNVLDLLQSRRSAPLNLSSPAGRFWPDVFVSSRLPWQRLVQSFVLHLGIIAMGSGLLPLLPQPRSVSAVFNESDVVYYSPSDYRSRSELPKVRPQITTAKKRAESAKDTPMIVAWERVVHREIIAPPNVKLRSDLRLLRMTASNSVVPMVPLGAIKQARLVVPVALMGVIAPSPSLRGMGRGPGITVPLPSAIDPPPSVNASLRQTGDISIGRMEIVGPPPKLPMHERTSISAMPGLGTEVTSVVPPPPAIDTLGSGGGEQVGSQPAAMAIVPPPPVVNGGAHYGTGAQGSADLDVVPPPPSLSGITNFGNKDLPRPPAVKIASLRANIASAVNASISPDSTRLRGRPSGLPVHGKAVDEAETSTAKSKELSVDFVGPVLPLASSSYFSSSEIFLAEERLNRNQLRMIKLVYDYLPYQHRLSDYGPNYPAVDRLRVTRDPACDESLMQVLSSVSASGGASTQSLQLPSKDLAEQRSTLPCFRTTADDYRRARKLQHR